MRASPSLVLGFCAGLLLLPLAGLWGQDTVRITQRQDLRRQIDGKPAGLYHEYSQSVWTLGSPAADGSRQVSAWAWTVGGTTQDLSRDAKEINGEYRSRFTLRADGSIKSADNSPAPFFRGFPVPPPQDAQPGSVWEAPAILVADPGGQGKWTMLNLLVQYTWVGSAVWKGQPVLEIRAKYAVRYRQGSDPKGDPDLKQVEGTRDAIIYLDPLTRFPVYIRELVGHELWQFVSGRKVQNDGFILTFYEGASYPTGLARLVQAPVPSPSSSGPVVAMAPTPAPLPSSAPVPSPRSSAAASAGPASSPSPAPSPTSASSPRPTASPDPGPLIASGSPAPSSLPALDPVPAASPAPAPSSTPASSPPTKPLVASLDPALEPRPGARRSQYGLDPELNRITQELMSGDLPSVTMTNEDRGINLTIENLQFQADSSLLLGAEGKRLDGIAAMLAKVPAGRNFLVVGHTALAGSAAGQKALSLERAKSIVEALKKRGIPAERFLFDGRGASQPIASNDTEAGRAKNRRVEIIILD